MAYTKTVWADGDIITAEKLNRLEGGVEDYTPDLQLGYNNGYFVENGPTPSELMQKYIDKDGNFIARVKLFNSVYFATVNIVGTQSGFFIYISFINVNNNNLTVFRISTNSSSTSIEDYSVATATINFDSGVL